jgi:hypothetical protein
MPTAANSARPKLQRMKLGRAGAKLVNRVQSLMLTGKEDRSGEMNVEEADDEEEEV